MIELTVADALVTATWYESALGFQIELHDPVRGFVLLSQPGGETKLALKQGTKPSSGVVLHFQSRDLQADIARLGHTGEARTSDEGYRRIKLRDPDGIAVVVFEWLTPS
jgi:hypothetical protein